MYNALLEEEFLHSSTAFYEIEAQTLFRDSDVSEYFKRVYFIYAVRSLHLGARSSFRGTGAR